jgi:serine protease Do
MMKNWKSLLVLSLFAFVFGILGAFTFFALYDSPSQASYSNTSIAGADDSVYYFSDYRRNISQNTSVFNSDFILASKKSRPAVVFIKAIQEGVQHNYLGMDLFFNFFNRSNALTQAGSGVIVSPDGYIVTNYHVIRNADKVEIVIKERKKTYQAKIIGYDESCDLALLKIDAEKLRYIEMANSDEVRVGEWVLAVGNPFNLTSTVTTGIVSFKGRAINSNNRNFNLESFIQTDAAINQGNSGGALVNLQGKLIGINTSILSETGSYIGYGFAIPSNIVMKVIKDLKEFGIVQRAFIEADFDEIDEDLASDLDENINGILVSAVLKNGNAGKAGLKKGDIITAINGVPVNSRAIFDEQLAYFRPCEKIKLTVLQNRKEISVDIMLVNSEGESSLLENNMVFSEILGASFKPISKRDKAYYDIDFGVKVMNIKRGMMQEMGLPNGFIILYVNANKFSSAEKLVQTLEKLRGRAVIKGYTPEGWLIQKSLMVY